MIFLIHNFFFQKKIVDAKDICENAKELLKKLKNKKKIPTIHIQQNGLKIDESLVISIIFILMEYHNFR